MSDHSSSGSGSSSEYSEDRPNITVDGDKEAHLNVNKDDEECTEGSIVAAKNDDVPVDPSKDPKISNVPEQKKEQAQSKCCILI